MAKKKKPPAIHACGCDTATSNGSDRKALGVDQDIKGANLARLNRIEGQVRGLHKMIEEDRYCADILTQISAVQQALRGVSRELMRNHLRHCVAQASKAGGEEADRVYDELIDLMHKNTR